MRNRRGRISTLLALAIPVGAGLTYLATFDAPISYLIMNASALGIAALWIWFGHGPRTDLARSMTTLVLLALLFLPILTGPAINDVARWIPLGSLVLHSGAFALPSLAVLAAQDEDYAPPILLAALLAGSLQPDAALGFAVVFAAVGLHDVTRDWRIGLVCIIGFFASIAMALRGDLPPQPFVERIFVTLFIEMPLAALGLLLAWAIGFALILFASSLDRASRYALAGSFFGFAMLALFSHYPTILIGYGVAPILGYGLALGLSGSNDAVSETDE